MSDSLTQHISNHLQLQQDDILQAFVDELKCHYHKSIIGVVFYGSCMRTRIYKDAMLDFYVVVDSYSHAYKNIWYRIANSLLPPNVFFIQITVNGVIYRAKYALMSEKGLLAGVEKSFHSYFWARFAQPIAYIYARDEHFKQIIVDVQYAALCSFYRNTVTMFSVEPSSHDFWVKGLQLTYAAELRAESKSRAKIIYASDCDYYNNALSALMNKNKCLPKNKFINNVRWNIRIVLGKILSVLRLMKATTTFVGGVDYIAWKIERHTGEPVLITNKMRKYPWIYIWPAVFNLFRQGKVR